MPRPSSALGNAIAEARQIAQEVGQDTDSETDTDDDTEATDTATTTTVGGIGVPTDALPDSVAGIDVPDPSAAPDPEPTPTDTQQQSDTQQQDAAPDPTPATSGQPIPDVGPGGIPQQGPDTTEPDTGPSRQETQQTRERAADQFNQERGVSTELAGIDVGGERAEQIADTAEQQFGMDVPDPLTAEDLQVTERDGDQRVVETTPAFQREQAAEQLDEQVPTEITAADVQLTDDGATLTEAARGDLRGFRIGQQAAENPILQALGRAQGVRDETTREQARQAEYAPLPNAEDVYDRLQTQAALEEFAEGDDTADVFEQGEPLGTTQATEAPTTELPEVEETPQLRALQQERTTNLQERFPDAADEIEQALEAETDAELQVGEDIVLGRDDGRITGRLSEEGQESVEVQNTPGGELPLIGPVLESGTRVRQDIREVTEGPRETFQSITPDADSVVGLLGAAAPVAAAEPTPFGEIGVGTAAGIGLTLAGASTLSESVVGADPTARAGELIPGESVVEQNELEPGDPTQDQSELQPTGTGITQSELEVGEFQTPELSVPTGGVFVSELSVGETPTDGTQRDTGGQDTVVPGDFPLPGRDVPANPDREFVQRDTPETILGTSPAFQTPEQQERGEQRETITGDDIPTTIEEPDQPGPSVRERQRRDDLFAPERAFPTGEDAIVGRETTETVEETQQRVEEAQTPFTVSDSVFGPTEGLLTGARDRLEEAQTPQVGAETEPDIQQDIAPVQTPFTVPQVGVRAQADVQAMQRQRLDLRQQQRTVTEQQTPAQETTPANPFVNPTEVAFANPTAPAYVTAPAFAPGAAGQSTLPEFEFPENENERDPLFLPEGEEFENPVASGAQFLGLGGGFGGGGSADNAGGLFSGRMDSGQSGDSGGDGAARLFGGGDVGGLFGEPDGQNDRDRPAGGLFGGGF